MPIQAVDAAGDIFIADYDNNRVREIIHATGVITTVAGNGIAGYSGDNGVATTGELSHPNGIAVDAAGDLFIADQGNNRIREVSHATGVITTVAGNGTQGYSGDHGLAISAEINGPIGVAVDFADDVFFADSNNNRIREVTNAAAGTISVAPIGTATTLTAPTTMLTYGQPITVTATVAPLAPSTLAPSEGIVTFILGANPVGISPVSDGTALLNNLLLPVGSDVITAVYSDTGGNFTGSTAVGLTAFVTAPGASGTDQFAQDVDMGSRVPSAAPVVLLSSAVSSFSSPQPVDHMAAFIGVPSLTANLPAVDNLMSQQAGEGGPDLGKWAALIAGNQSGTSSMESTNWLDSGSESTTIAELRASSVNEDVLQTLAVSRQFSKA